jgi:hypothetical protein
MQQRPVFLISNEIRAKLGDLIRGSTGVDLAIAYWGANAGKTLGMDLVEGPVRILCDARSGACNPDELKHLLQRGFVIKTRNGLHAKVAITSTSVIVG